METGKITAINSQAKSYHSSGNAYYRPAYARCSVGKVNSIMSNRNSLSSILNGIPGYMVSALFVEKLSLKG